MSSAREMISKLLPQSLKDRVKAALGMPLGFLHDDWKILAALGQTNSPHVVLDVGAYHGWFAHCWLGWCKTAQVYLFEPTPSTFAELSKLHGSDSRMHLVNAGVGAQEGKLQLKIHDGSAVCNSFLANNSESWERIRYDEHPVSEVSVDVVTLDGFCLKAGITSVHLIKIDVQGFERQVLEGARDVLSFTKYVFVEAGILKLYEGASNFGEIIDLMAARGFHLFDMRAWHRGNKVLVEADLLFRRNGLAPPVSTEGDRWYVSLQ